LGVSRRGELKKHDKNLKTNLTNPGTFLASEDLVNHVKARRFFFEGPLGQEHGPRAPPKKKETTTKKQNNPGKKQPTDFPLFFPPLFFAGVKRYARRLWTSCPPTSYHRMWWSAAGSGVFLYELVPSDDPFIWYLCETILFSVIVSFFLSNRHFFFHPKNKLSS
jgi:hypothetical protein